MFLSKADRILSRYRPIAPKPLPLPPSGSFATDPSSTCASLDSYASSCKARRTRKRRIPPANLSSAKCPKTPKSEKPQIVSALSNNNAVASASSLTQGNSDGMVPLGDLSHASHSFVVQEHAATPLSTSQHLVMDASERAHMPSSDPAVAETDPAMAATPFLHHVAGNLVEQARMFMVADALKARQQPSLSQALQLKDNAGGGIIEKDLAFMERAAASTVVPDRGTTAGLSCSAVCMIGVGLGGGGFTEMIRGITRLPTAADVQSLMQARAGPATASAASPGMLSPLLENTVCGQSSPGGREAHHQRLELDSPLPAAPVSWAPNLPSQPLQVDDCTLPLLPNFPSKLSLSPPPTLQAEPSTHHSSYRAVTFSNHPDLGGSEQPAMFLSVGVSERIPAIPAVGSRGSSGQLDTLRRANNEAHDAEVRPPFHKLNFLGGLAPPCPPSALVRDGATVDQVYLQQVYGGSTDPVLLVDDNHQVLWFNKAYDRALKSVSERLSSKPATTGPYFDPLGHPTPLGNLVLNLASPAPKPVSATLWGFLKKLVMPEVDTASPMLGGLKVQVSRQEAQCEDLDSSRLCLSVESRVPHSMSHACSNSVPACRMDDVSEVQGCGRIGKLTTVTLESITEVYMGESAATMECVEMVEARLGVAGSMPAFITDCTSRVRWVNAAFKQMLGLSEQQGNSTVMARHGTGSSNVGALKHEPPELTFVCSAEKVPRSAWAFSGRVNLEWMKAGKRRSMTVPCDVSRFVTSATWVWKFDIALSLSLNLSV